MPTESTRKKACASCRLAKTRCNLAFPRCSRCEMRRLECIYERKIHGGPISSSKDSDQNTELNIDSGTEPSLRPSFFQAAGALVEHADTPQSTAPQNPRRIAPDTPLGQGLDAGLESVLDLDWEFDIDSWIPARSVNLNDQTTTILEDLNPISQYPTSAKDIGISYFPLRQPQITDSNPMTTDTDSQYQEREILSPPPMPWSRLPPEGRALVQNSPRLFTSFSVQHTTGIFLPRTFATPASSLTAKYLKAMLSSYPKLMIQNSVLPPYIHSYTLNNLSDDCLCRKDKTSLPESLAICSSIVQMSVTKMRESHAFVWKTIRLEQERLYRKVCTLDRQSLKEKAEVKMLIC